ncbi:serine/threonine protein kinase [Modestobacter sp. URMC 112]
MEPKGRTFGGRYDLVSLIATGGMGQVWRARDTRLHRDVAVKVLRSEYTGDPDFLARFRAEAQHTAQLHHPNIATLFDYGEVLPAESDTGEHLAYLVMELVDGETLSALLGRERRLRPERALDVLQQAAAGLAAAHAIGVVHRDIKPGNLLVARDGRVKITDFGAAWSASSVPLTQTGQVIGTAQYLSPEQAQGVRANAASDVYSLGVVAYECLAGRRAFSGDNSVQIALKQISESPEPLPDDVPAGVRQLVERAMAKDPAQRFPDGAAFRAAIEDTRAGRPPAAPPVPLPVAAPPPAPPTVPPTAPPTVPPAAATRVAATSALPAAAPAMPATALLPVQPTDRPAGGRPGPPVGPPDDEVPAEDPGERSRRRLLLPLIAVLAVAAIVFGVVRTFGAADPASDATAVTTTAPTTAPTTTAVPRVLVVAGNYVGRPVSVVQSELSVFGLAVTLRPLQTGDVPDGQVIAVDPVGELAPGSPITVTHAVAPPPPPPPPTPEPTPEPTAEPTEEPEPTEDQQTEEERKQEEKEKKKEEQRKRDKDDD